MYAEHEGRAWLRYRVEWNLISSRKFIKIIPRSFLYEILMFC